MAHLAPHGYGLHAELQRGAIYVRRGPRRSRSVKRANKLARRLMYLNLVSKKECKPYVMKYCFFTCVPIPHLSCLHSCYAVISCCLRLFRLETAHKRGCYWTIEQPRSSLMAAYGPFKDRFCCLHAASMMVPLSRVLFLSHLIGRRPLRGMGHTLYTSPWVPWGRPR